VLPPAAALAALLSLLIPRGPPPPQRSDAGRWQRLLREDAGPPARGGRWNPLRSLGARLRRRVPLRRRRRWARGGLLLVLVAAVSGPVAAFVLQTRAAASTPERAVLAYWDHLDFRRFDDAYALLAPGDGLDYERWLLERSLVGGLRSSYAKLDAIEPELLAYRRSDGGTASIDAAEGPALARVGDEARVAVDLTWFTPLTVIEERVEHTLVRTDDGWRLRAEVRPIPRARDQVAAEASVDWYRSPRRPSDPDGAVSAARLDRPEIETTALRLVRYVATKTPLEIEAEAVFTGRPESEIAPREARWALVGEVRNAGPYPADVTVTGLLRDAEGRELARANPGALLASKLLSGERSPFRIDFEAVDFGLPDGATPPVAVGEVFARGVVTGRATARDLIAWSRIDGDRVELRLDNVGSVEATVPQALVTLYDADGPAWLAEAVALEAVPARGRGSLEVALTKPEGYEVVWERAAASLPAAEIDHPDWTGYRVTVRAFERERR
jgi:hypothetical protein